MGRTLSGFEWLRQSHPDNATLHQNFEGWMPCFPRWILALAPLLTKLSGERHLFCQSGRVR